MSKFFIGDPHFGHKALPKYRTAWDSLEEYEEAFVKKYNERLSKRDICVFVGDVNFTKQSFSIFERLNGSKIIVGGNHDNWPLKNYLNPKYKIAGIYGAVEMDQGIITHIPVHLSQMDRYRFNVHGHLHDKVITKAIKIHNGRPISVPDERYINVCCEKIAYTPIEYQVLVAENKVIRDSLGTKTGENQ